MWKQILVCLMLNNLQILATHATSENKCEKQNLKKCDRLFYGNHTNNDTELGLVRAFNGNQTKSGKIDVPKVNRVHHEDNSVENGN